MRKSKIYAVWCSMKQRCLNQNCKDYPYYGGRGIKLYKEWISFIPFFKWSELNGYREGLQIDRINNEGDYSPENCRFVDRIANMRNRRNNITYNGELAKDASLRLGGEKNLIYIRLRDGWSKEKAFNTPLLRHYK